jgi:hypothetical protein
MMITTGGDGDVATRRLFHIVLAVFGLSLLLIPLDPVYSSTVDVGGVGFEARVGFSDRFRPGTWVPVWIHVTNAGIPFDAHIEVITTAGNPYSSRQTRVVYRRPVRLPSGTRKQFTFNIPLTNTAVPIDVRLVELNGNILSNRRISLRESAITSDIVLILDTTGEKWTWLHEVVPTTRSFSPQTRVYVAHARSETDLPTEWVAYESIRTVILTPSFPIASLAPEQITALVDWIKAGGHLLVAGGPGLDLVSVSELADRLPVALSNASRVVTLEEMGYNVPPLPAPTPVLATLARLVRGKVDLAVDDIPLIAHCYVGTGRITYIGFDLGAAPLRTWEAFDYFSRSLVFPPRMVRRSTGSLEQQFLPLVSAQKVPYPRHLWLFIFFFAYGSAIAGSLRLGTKHPAGWLVLTAAIGVGTLFAQAVINTQTKKAMKAYAEVRVSLVDPVSTEASSAVFAGLVDMHGGDWVFSRDGDMHIAPAGQSVYGDPQLLVVEHTDAESRLGPAPPRRQLAVTAQMLEEIPVRVTVTRDWQTITVSLDNQTSWPLHSAFYVDRERWAYLGQAGPGEQTEASFPAYQYMVASDSLSPKWLANSVASIAGRRNPRLDRRQLDGLAHVVHHALTPVGQSLDLPWGSPIIVAMIEKPTQPPLLQDVWATGYHYLVFPAGRD